MQEQLDSVDLAIRAIEGGVQSYTTVLGQTVTRGNLKDLYAQRAELQALVDLAALSGEDGPTRIGVAHDSADRPT